MLIFLGGVPGVGKTTLITKTIEIAKKRQFEMEKISGAPIFCKLAGVKTMAEVRILPESLRKKLRPEMNRQLYEIDRNNPRIIRLVDSHFVLFDTEGKEYGTREIQPWDKEQTIAIIVVTANSKTILGRRIQDAVNRPDRQKTLISIVQEQELEVKIASTQAKELSIPLCLISNEDADILTAPEKLFSFCVHLRAM